MFSKRWFTYYDDNSVVYAINADESNTRLVNPSGDVGAITTGIPPLRKGVKARSITLKLSDGTTRICYPLKPATYAAITEGDTYAIPNFDGSPSGTAAVVILKNPEKRRRQPIPNDTALIDGTQP